MNNAKPKLAKHQAKAKQQPEAELLPFENYSLLLYTKTSASGLMRFLMTIKMRLKVKNRSHISNIYGPRPIHRLKYTKYKI